MSSLLDEKQDERTQNPGDADWDNRVTYSNLGQAEENIDEPEMGDSAAQKKGPSAAENIRSTAKVFQGGKINPVALMGLLSKNKQSGGIVLGIVGFGLMLLLGINTQSMVLVGASHLLTNFHLTSAPASSISSRGVISQKVQGVAKSACATITYRCRFGTMNDYQIQKLEDAGFKVEKGDQLADGRTRVTSLETIDRNGKPVKITSGRELKNTVKGDASIKASFDKAYNFRAKPFFSEKISGIKSALTRFNIGRSPPDADSPKKHNEAMDKNAGIETDADGKRTLKGAVDGFRSNISAKAGKLDSVSDIASAVCTAYDVNNAILAGEKAFKYAEYAKFGMFFLSKVSKLMAGDAKPGEIDGLATQAMFTRKDADPVKNPDRYSKTFTDSEGYKMAMFGKREKLSKWAQEYSLKSSHTGLLRKLMDGITNIDIPGTKADTPREKRLLIRKACKVANSDATAAATIGAMCAGATAPTLIGAVVAGAVCVVGNFVLGELVGSVLQRAIKEYTDDAIAALSKLDLGSNLTGVDFGNALFVSSGLILGTMSSAKGGAPGGKAVSRQYAKATYGENQLIAQAGTEAAKKTPFDTTTPYSFISSLSTKLVGYGIIGRDSMNLTAPILGALNSSVTPAYALSGYFMPSEYDGNYYEGCDSKAELDSGAAINNFCMPTQVFQPSEMSDDIGANKTVQDYIFDNKFADEVTGEPTDTDNGKKYQNYLTYCANRQEPWFVTEKSVTEGDDEEDYEWYTGYKCVIQDNEAMSMDASLGNDAKMLSMFRAFTLQKSELDMMEEEPTLEGSGSGSQGTGEATGEFDLPVADPNALLSSCYGLRPALGDMHYAIDLAGPAGMAIKAADGGKVTQVNLDNSAPFTGFGRSIVIEHGQGTYTRYSHLQDVKVKVGDNVTKGQDIATQGGSGGGTAGVVQDGAYAIHLDFGVSTQPNVPNTKESSNPMKVVNMPPTVQNPHQCSADYNGEGPTKDDPQNKF